METNEEMKEMKQINYRQDMRIGRLESENRLLKTILEQVMGIELIPKFDGWVNRE